MFDLIPLFVFGLIGLFIVMKARAVKRDTEILCAAAKECGLRAKGGNAFITPTIAGNIGSHFVTVCRVKKDGRYYFEILLKYSHRMKTYFSLEREGYLGRMKRSIGFSVNKTRDTDFDAAVRIETDTPYIMTALLNGDARNGIRILAEQTSDFIITNDEARADVYVNNLLNGHELAVVIRNVCETVSCLDRGEHPWQLLAESIAAETIPAVAVEKIRALAGHYSIVGEARSALQSCLGSGSPVVQVEAARHLGEEGLAHLVKMLDDGSTPAALFGEIIGVIRDDGYGKAAPALGRLYEKSDDPELRAKSIKCLGSFGNKKLSPFVVQALKDSDAGVREAAVKALALCGTVEAVEPLWKLAESTINPFLKSDIQKTIEAIQAGLEIGDRGMLSIQKGDDMEGALSRDDSPGEGALSGDDDE